MFSIGSFLKVFNMVANSLVKFGSLRKVSENLRKMISKCVSLEVFRMSSETFTETSENVKKVLYMILVEILTIFGGEILRKFLGILKKLILTIFL